LAKSSNSNPKFPKTLVAGDPDTIFPPSS